MSREQRKQRLVHLEVQKKLQIIKRILEEVSTAIKSYYESGLVRKLFAVNDVVGGVVMLLFWTLTMNCSRNTASASKGFPTKLSTV